MLLLTIIIIIISFSIYQRYVPVNGVQCHPEIPPSAKAVSIEILDVREYNLSYSKPIPGALNLPIAYLKRHRHELSGKTIYLVASSKVEKNLSIRWLRRNGYSVSGFTLTDWKSEGKHNGEKGYCYGV
jgi:rhodanese-related sulfurtransferase